MKLNPQSSGLLRVWRDTTGASAIEFAIWAQVMSLVLLGGVDITRYAIATGRITDVASTIGQMLAVNAGGSVNYVDVQFYHDSAAIIYPQVLADAKQQGITWSSDMAITMSSLTFSLAQPSCTINCTYNAQVVWTSGTSPRSCKANSITPAASDTSAPSPQTLPPDVFGPTSLLAVDIVYTFRPILAPRFLPQIKIARSYYLAPRYVPTVTYSVIQGDPGTVTVCS